MNNEEQNTNNHIRTTNTALAAYLVSEGFGTPDIDFEGDRASFVFSKEDPTIEQAISNFDTARATSNTVLFFNAYKSLLRRIRERY